jgi:hypothetical protein
MSWVSLILLILRIVDAATNWLRDQQGIKAGEDAEIAKASAAILLKTQSAKQIMAEVTAMTDAQVDEALKRLES